MIDILTLRSLYRLVRAFARPSYRRSFYMSIVKKNTENLSLKFSSKTDKFFWIWKGYAQQKRELGSIFHMLWPKYDGPLILTALNQLGYCWCCCFPVLVEMFCSQLSGTEAWLHYWLQSAHPVVAAKSASVIWLFSLDRPCEDHNANDLGTAWLVCHMALPQPPSHLAQRLCVVFRFPLEHNATENFTF